MDIYVRLDKSTFTQRGWPVPAAQLPGAKLGRLLIKGEAQDIENNWKLEGGHLRPLSGIPPLADGDLLISLTNTLVATWVPVIAAFGAALIGALATYAAASKQYRVPITTYQVVQCREALSSLKLGGVERRTSESWRLVGDDVYNRCYVLTEALERRE